MRVAAHLRRDPRPVRGLPSIAVRERPILDASLYEARNTVTPPTAEALALIQAGVATDRQHPEWAVTYFRDAATGLPEIPGEGGLGGARPGPRGAHQGAYRRAIEYMLETAHRQAKAENGPGPRCWPGQGSASRAGSALYDATRWEEVLPTRRFEVTGFRHRTGREGSGPQSSRRPVRYRGNGEKARPRTPVACRAVQEVLPKDEIPGGLGHPAGSGPGEPLAVLELHDPVLVARHAVAVDLRRTPACPWPTT